MPTRSRPARTINRKPTPHIVPVKPFPTRPELKSAKNSMISKSQTTGTVAKSKRLTLSIFNDLKAPTPLIGDSLRLRQVLVNLLGNAIKFTEQGRVTLTINIQHIDAHTLRLLFSVKDTGVGIDPQLQ
jgi:signal transduction histidine kinase